MAHQEQKDFFISVKSNFPEFFKNKKVLDVGSLDINGNNRYLFEDCEYVGLDVAEGKNVDIVSLAHQYNATDASFDVIITNDCFEHDMFYQETLKNIFRLLKPGGLFVFTCKTTGSAEHGTLRSDGGFSSPLTSKIPEWANYYRNITEADVREVLNINELFFPFEFSVLNTTFDLRFYGIKK